MSRTDDQISYVLPASVITRLDIARVISQAEAADNALTSASVRAKAGASAEAPPVVSDLLREFLTANQLDFNDSQQRSKLIAGLRSLKDNLPVIHMTFAAPADQESLQQIAGWLRQSVHPQAVISVGLQPGLIGGVYIRTTNHVHDLSVRAQLAGHRDLLVKEIEALSGTR